MDALVKTPAVIAVDLDGTLTPTDTLHEAALCLLRDSPLNLLALPFWLMRGKAALKAQVAARAALDVTVLPYNLPLIAWLKDQRAAGAKIVLSTASDRRVAQAIADHLGVFDDVIASDGTTNNAGPNKRAALDARYGEGGYDYAGNSTSDMPVWAGARQAIVVNASAALARRAAGVTTVAKVFPGHAITPRQWRKLFRVHQWLKNLLQFVPLLAAHEAGNLHALATLLLAFVAFSLCASAVYMTNDLLDLESDRRHPSKRHRPFASAAVPIKLGVTLAPVCAVASLGLGLLVGRTFTVWLVFYFLLTCAYSLRLKRLALIDCLTLAALYTLRIIAGAAAVAITLSFWLLAFSVFIFLSLAFVKRYAELQLLAGAGNDHAHGRGYLVADAPVVQALGIAAGYAAVLVLALYLHGETVVTLYAQPELIWFAVPLMLFWVSWVWMKAHRGEMHDDPIVFALKDRASLVIAQLVALCFLLANQGLGG
ncbi:4-hydroxybenzoate polyprenyltransferase [Pseudoduganella flava]|uniref:4-hydroxybenzoate polyprenyltransferase n=1 Tax=Pseudoduganella flava TaxID=871742 RepID=A0A562Q0S2_9BURK|nr:UbiA family prenyltransferase [Pseudoduganella flava]QGZ38218.1 UbiA family prenyltransferase [Pseudoduganella flava]TWI50254.1 4-hydroxybenzoate polyprenyltransferase [Pseudoduganella flava]